MIEEVTCVAVIDRSGDLAESRISDRREHTIIYNGHQSITCYYISGLCYYQPKPHYILSEGLCCFKFNGVT